MSGLNGFLITGFHSLLVEYTASLKMISLMSSSNVVFLFFMSFTFTLAAIPSSSDSSKNESPTAGAPGFTFGFSFGVGFGFGLSSPVSAAAEGFFLGAAFGS